MDRCNRLIEKCLNVWLFGWMMDGQEGRRANVCTSNERTNVPKNQ